MKDFEISVLTANSRYLQTAALKEPFSGVSTDFRPIYTKSRKIKFSDNVTLLLDKCTLSKQSYLYFNIRLESLYIASVSLKKSSEEQR